MVEDVMGTPELAAKIGQVISVPIAGQDAISLQIEELLGVGTFAGVYVARNVGNGDRYALKVTFKTEAEYGRKGDNTNNASADSGYESGAVSLMSSNHITEAVSESSNDSGLDLMRREAALHGAITEHDGIVKLVAAFEDADCAYLLLELCDDDLYNFIQRGAGPNTAVEEGEGWVGNNLLNSDENVRRIFAEILRAVEHVHAHGVFHRDLKPENVLLDFGAANPVGNLGFGVKLADFGLATRATFCKDLACGTRGYLPPESLDPTLDGYDPRAADAWALGMILINLRFQCKLWQVADPQEDPYYAQFLANPRDYLQRTFPVFSDAFVNLLEKVFHPCPAKRANLADLVAWVESGIAFTKEWEEMSFNDVFEAPEAPIEEAEDMTMNTSGHVKLNIEAPKPVTKSALRYSDDANDPWWMESDEEQLFSPSAATVRADDLGSLIDSTESQSTSPVSTGEGETSPTSATTRPIDFAASSLVSNGMSYSVSSSFGCYSQDNASFYYQTTADIPCALLDTTPFQIPESSDANKPPLSPSSGRQPSTPVTGSGVQVSTVTATPETGGRMASVRSPPVTPMNPKASKMISAAIRGFTQQFKTSPSRDSATAAPKLALQTGDALECLDAQMSGLTLDLEEGLVMGV